TREANYAANADKYGDAQYEVSSNGVSSPTGWSDGYSNFPSSTYPVFSRGGRYGNGSNAGVFAFGLNTGQPYSYYCWRRGLHFVTSVPFSPFIYSKQINTTSVYSQLCKLYKTYKTYKTKLSRYGKLINENKVLYMF
ncbi:MAG: hypothetical protein RR664_07080, partial [Clostridia bacterium]